MLSILIILTGPIQPSEIPFTTTTNNNNNSLQHQADQGQHSYARSSSYLIYLKPPSLHPPRKFPFPLNLYL